MKEAHVFKLCSTSPTIHIKPDDEMTRIFETELKAHFSNPEFKKMCCNRYDFKTVSINQLVQVVVIDWVIAGIRATSESVIF